MLFSQPSTLKERGSDGVYAFNYQLRSLGLTTPDSELYRRAMICPIPGGFLVAVEGIDGSGKTTQAERLARYCDEKRLTYVLSKEPTSGKYGQLIRNSASRGRLSAEEELDILLKDRREHVDQVIQPALDQEKVVILDRYYFSTAAYQGAHGADPEIILSRNESFAPQPDFSSFSTFHHRPDCNAFGNAVTSRTSLKHLTRLNVHVQSLIRSTVRTRLASTARI